MSAVAVVCGPVLTQPTDAGQKDIGRMKGPVVAASKQRKSKSGKKRSLAEAVLSHDKAQIAQTQDVFDPTPSKRQNTTRTTPDGKECKSSDKAHKTAADSETPTQPSQQHIKKPANPTITGGSVKTKKHKFPKAKRSVQFTSTGTFKTSAPDNSAAKQDGSKSTPQSIAGCSTPAGQNSSNKQQPPQPAVKLAEAKRHNKPAAARHLRMASTELAPSVSSPKEPVSNKTPTPPSTVANTSVTPSVLAKASHSSKTKQAAGVDKLASKSKHAQEAHDTPDRPRHTSKLAQMLLDTKAHKASSCIAATTSHKDSPGTLKLSQLTLSSSPAPASKPVQPIGASNATVIEACQNGKPSRSDCVDCSTVATAGCMPQPSILQPATSSIAKLTPQRQMPLTNGARASPKPVTSASINSTSKRMIRMLQLSSPMVTNSAEGENQIPAQLKWVACLGCKHVTGSPATTEPLKPLNNRPFSKRAMAAAGKFPTTGKPVETSATAVMLSDDAKVEDSTEGAEHQGTGMEPDVHQGPEQSQDFNAVGQTTTTNVDPEEAILEGTPATQVAPQVDAFSPIIINNDSKVHTVDQEAQQLPAGSSGKQLAKSVANTAATADNSVGKQPSSKQQDTQDAAQSGHATDVVKAASEVDVDTNAQIGGSKGKAATPAKGTQTHNAQSPVLPQKRQQPAATMASAAKRPSPVCVRALARIPTDNDKSLVRGVSNASHGDDRSKQRSSPNSCHDASNSTFASTPRSAVKESRDTSNIVDLTQSDDEDGCGQSQPATGTPVISIDVDGDVQEHQPVCTPRSPHSTFKTTHVECIDLSSPVQKAGTANHHTPSSDQDYEDINEWDPPSPIYTPTPRKKAAESAAGRKVVAEGKADESPASASDQAGAGHTTAAACSSRSRVRRNNKKSDAGISGRQCAALMEQAADGVVSPVCDDDKKARQGGSGKCEAAGDMLQHVVDENTQDVCMARVDKLVDSLSPPQSVPYSNSKETLITADKAGQVACTSDKLKSMNSNGPTAGIAGHACNSYKPTSLNSNVSTPTATFTASAPIPITGALADSDAEQQPAAAPLARVNALLTINTDGHQETGNEVQPTAEAYLPSSPESNAGFVLHRRSAPGYAQARFGRVPSPNNSLFNTPTTNKPLQVFGRHWYDSPTTHNGSPIPGLRSHASAQLNLAGQDSLGSLGSLGSPAVRGNSNFKHQMLADPSHFIPSGWGDPSAESSLMDWASADAEHLMSASMLKQDVNSNGMTGRDTPASADKDSVRETSRTAFYANLRPACANKDCKSLSATFQKESMTSSPRTRGEQTADVQPSQTIDEPSNPQQRSLQNNNGDMHLVEPTGNKKQAHLPFPVVNEKRAQLLYDKLAEQNTEPIPVTQATSSQPQKRTLKQQLLCSFTKPMLNPQQATAQDEPAVTEVAAIATVPPAAGVSTRVVQPETAGPMRTPPAGHKTVPETAVTAGSPMSTATLGGTWHNKKRAAAMLAAAKGSSPAAPSVFAACQRQTDSTVVAVTALQLASAAEHPQVTATPANAPIITSPPAKQAPVKAASPFRAQAIGGVLACTTQLQGRISVPSPTVHVPNRLTSQSPTAQRRENGSGQPIVCNTNGDEATPMSPKSFGSNRDRSCETPGSDEKELHDSDEPQSPVRQGGCEQAKQPPVGRHAAHKRKVACRRIALGASLPAPLPTTEDPVGNDDLPDDLDELLDSLQGSEQRQDAVSAETSPNNQQRTPPSLGNRLGGMQQARSAGSLKQQDYNGGAFQAGGFRGSNPASMVSSRLQRLLNGAPRPGAPTRRLYPGPLIGFQTRASAIRAYTSRQLDVPLDDDVGLADEGHILHVPRNTVSCNGAKNITSPVAAPWRPRCDLEQQARESHHNWKFSEVWHTHHAHWARIDLSGQEAAMVELRVRKTSATAAMFDYKERYGSEMGTALQKRLTAEWEQMAKVRAAAGERAVRSSVDGCNFNDSESSSPAGGDACSPAGQNDDVDSMSHGNHVARSWAPDDFKCCRKPGLAADASQRQQEGNHDSLRSPLPFAIPNSRALEQAGDALATVTTIRRLNAGGSKADITCDSVAKTPATAAGSKGIRSTPLSILKSHGSGGIRKRRSVRFAAQLESGGKPGLKW